MPSSLRPYLRRMALGAALFGAVLTFAAPQPSFAAGEPTLAISMNNTELTLGTVSTVTFAFSAVPIGFDNSDVNLSDANGTLSTVTASADVRVWTATFTPNAGVNDVTNTISVGVQWTDTLGVSPLGPSTGPNYTIATASSTASNCPPPSLYVASPKGGETFVAGTAVDVFWTANGCQLASVRLALSVDGGVSYAEPFATSAAPFSGYYRWTVPDFDAPYARLRVTLMGQGNVEFTSDETDGTFTIFPSQPSAPSSASTAAATSSTEAPSVQPEDPPPPEAGTSAGGSETAAPAPMTGEPAAPTPPTRPRERPSGAPKPAVAAPTAATSAQENPPAPPEPPVESTTVEPNPPTMPETSENQALQIENVQAAVETAAGFAPSSMELGFSFVLGALAMLAAMLGARKVMRDLRDKQGRTCGHCHGTGEKAKDADAPGVCADCEGSGTVEEEEEQSVECTHCGGEGADPCHECEGEGKDAAGNECAACRGGGLTLEDPDDESSDEPADCEICGGEGEVGAALKKQVACESCHGTGKA